MKSAIRHLLILGLILCFGGPMAGFLCTAIGMIGVFQSTGNNGISDPQGLAHHIGNALVVTVVGMVVGVVGLGLIIFSLILQYAGKSSGPAVPPSPGK